MNDVLKINFNLQASMSVFALWPVISWKYVFVQFEYVTFFKNLFLYFNKWYFNVTMCKYVHKNERGYVDFFFQLNFLPPYSFSLQGDDNALYENQKC